MTDNQLPEGCAAATVAAGGSLPPLRSATMQNLLTKAARSSTRQPQWLLQLAAAMLPADVWQPTHRMSKAHPDHLLFFAQHPDVPQDVRADLYGHCTTDDLPVPAQVPVTPPGAALLVAVEDDQAASTLQQQSHMHRRHLSRLLLRLHPGDLGPQLAATAVAHGPLNDVLPAATAVADVAPHMFVRRLADTNQQAAADAWTTVQRLGLLCGRPHDHHVELWQRYATKLQQHLPAAAAAVRWWLHPDVSVAHDLFDTNDSSGGHQLEHPVFVVQLACIRTLPPELASDLVVAYSTAGRQQAAEKLAAKLLRVHNLGHERFSAAVVAAAEQQERLRPTFDPQLLDVVDAVHPAAVPTWVWDSSHVTDQMRIAALTAALEDAETTDRRRNQSRFGLQIMRDLKITAIVESLTTDDGRRQAAALAHQSPLQQILFTLPTLANATDPWLLPVAAASGAAGPVLQLLMQQLDAEQLQVADTVMDGFDGTVAELLDVARTTTS